MNQLEAFKHFVAAHGYRLTLGEMLRSSHAAEYRKMATLLRHEGWEVIVDQNRSEPGGNIYTFAKPAEVKVEDAQPVCA